MHVLVVYGTNSGGTKEVAELVALDFAKAGHSVSMKSAEYTVPADLDGYDCVVLGSCTWEKILPTKRFEGQLQQHMGALRDKLKGVDLSGKKLAIFGLGDSSYTNFCIAATHLEVLVKESKATQVGPTLRVDSYFFDQEANRKRIKDWADQLLAALKAA